MGKGGKWLAWLASLAVWPALAQRYDDRSQAGSHVGIGPTFAGLVFMIMAWAVLADGGWWHKGTAGRPWLRTVLVLGLPALVFWLFSPSALAGNIYICKGAHGVNTYQNVPCPKPADQIRHDTYDDALGRPGTPVPDGIGYGQRVPVRGVASRLVGAVQAPVSLPPPAPPATGGLGSSAYQRGEMQGTRCVNARGDVYYTAAGCGTSTRPVGNRAVPRDWQQDTVQGRPDLVMSGPDQAFDPATGQFIQLQHAPDTQTVNVYQTTRDQGTAVDVDEACMGAQQQAAQDPYSQQAQRRVEDLCRRGRSLYDTQPSAHSLYSGG
ncbi:DUF4124 domain-containing protein [Rhodanobacter lindaniclasticus]